MKPLILSLLLVTACYEVPSQSIYPAVHIGDKVQANIGGPVMAVRYAFPPKIGTMWINNIGDIRVEEFYSSELHKVQ